MSKNWALLLIDIQYDFLQGGSLAVTHGNEILAPILIIANQFQNIIATQDWHPAGHQSFASSHRGHKPFDEVIWNQAKQTLWPDHCIQNSKGAQLHSEIQALPLTGLIQKGTHPEIDSYSGFFDNQKKFKTALDAHLKENQISHLVVAGLATDYCVKFTVLDALELGYRVWVYKPGIRAVNLHPDDGKIAVEEMQSRGAEIISEMDQLPLSS